MRCGDHDGVGGSSRGDGDHNDAHGNDSDDMVMMMVVVILMVIMLRWWWLFR